MQWACWRICEVPGNVDFLGTVEASNLDEAETVAKRSWTIEFQQGERLDVEIDDEAERVDVPFVFWRCPDHPQGNVSWNFSGEKPVATCSVCGRKSR